MENCYYGVAILTLLSPGYNLTWSLSLEPLVPGTAAIVFRTSLRVAFSVVFHLF